MYFVRQRPVRDHTTMPRWADMGGNADCWISRAQLRHMSACHDTDRHNAATHFLSGINRRLDGLLPVALSPDIRSASISIRQIAIFTGETSNNCDQFSNSISQNKNIIDFDFPENLESPTTAYISFSAPLRIRHSSARRPLASAFSQGIAARPCRFQLSAFISHSVIANPFFLLKKCNTSINSSHSPE
ncbi:hypothetical protein KDW40_18155 [Burkholderia cenocepacia]|uniref:hypothetical protein n=1 Tax=Burkholderia cepacia complex TaxID=87882 RepID=UPI001B8DC099|nr:MULTISPECIES: hypothetical protein [Burkholderia cepacia complex]MBR8040512.1 hypothetical protein [Burkholderia cenocepacia]MBR8327656.1 hypothetical protein [Burkholderia cenocepacia]MDN7583453.1 hypothetical protein [Burkholderia orbicola]